MAVSSDGIAKVEIYIDGVYAFDAPYGGNRRFWWGFPDVAGSTQSGFSLPSTAVTSAGTHTISALAYDAAGDTFESAADEEWFDSSFIASAMQ